MHMEATVRYLKATDFEGERFEVTAQNVTTRHGYDYGAPNAWPPQSTTRLKSGSGMRARGRSIWNSSLTLTTTTRFQLVSSDLEGLDSLTGRAVGRTPQGVRPLSLTEPSLTERKIMTYTATTEHTTESNREADERWMRDHDDSYTNVELHADSHAQSMVPALPIHY